MLLSVPANWEESFLYELKKYPVDSLYGSFDKSLFGSGRPAIALPIVSKKYMERFIEKARSLNIKFNYLLNAPCLGNLEYNNKFKNDFLKHIKWLQDIGVNSITVTIPYLVPLIKKNCPELLITVSTIANINSVRKAKFFEELGVDTITLDDMINRDFDLLKKIRKNIKCKIQLILNHICLYQCPLRNYHYNVVGHASQMRDESSEFYLDYCVANCNYIRYSRPSEIIKTRWIRPEDVMEYEKIGINLFKISGRGRCGSWILNACQAYSNRKYKGNLIDLLDCAETPKIITDSEKEANSLHMKYLGIQFRNIFKYIKYIRHLSIKQFNMFLRRYMNSSNISKYFYIENDKFNGFIEYFKNNNCTGLCNECNYCEDWSLKVLKINQIEIKNYLSTMEKVLEIF